MVDHMQKPSAMQQGFSDEPLVTTSLAEV